MYFVLLSIAQQMKTSAFPNPTSKGLRPRFLVLVSVTASVAHFLQCEQFAKTRCVFDEKVFQQEQNQLR